MIRTLCFRQYFVPEIIAIHLKRTDLKKHYGIIIYAILITNIQILELEYRNIEMFHITILNSTHHNILFLLSQHNGQY